MIQILIEMNLQAEKIKLIEWLVGLKDISTIQKIVEVRNQSVNKSLPQISIEQLKARALKSEVAIKQGDYTTFDDLKEEIKAW